VNGKALRGLGMEEARDALRNVDSTVDLVSIIVKKNIKFHTLFCT
jgi:hypothetical protein